MLRMQYFAGPLKWIRFDISDCTGFGGSCQTREQLPLKTYLNLSVLLYEPLVVVERHFSTPLTFRAGQTLPYPFGCA